MKALCLKRILLPLAFCIALTEFTTPAQTQDSTAIGVPRRTSIIFIQVDGLGLGDLSCNGQQKFQTPNIDKLAADGINFTNYSSFGPGFAANSWQHSSLLAGESLGHSKLMVDADVIFAGGKMTVTEILKNSGYHTGLIGDWNLGDENVGAPPWRKGFDEFAGYFVSYQNWDKKADFYADHMFRYAPGAIINTNNQREDFIGNEELYPNTNGKKSQYIPDLLATAAANFIKNNQPDFANHWRPFFLLLNLTIPNGKIEVPSDAPYSEENWPQAAKNRAAFISRLDGYVAKIQEQLGKSKMTNNVVIFLAGASVPKKTDELDPEFFHSNTSTNDFRVPMIVRWTGKIAPGQTSDLKWSAKDFLPTAADIAFTSSPTNITGVSVLKTLIGDNSPAP